MIKVHPLNKLKYGKITSFDEGIIFCTYAALIGESSQTGKFSTRLKQLVQWCGKDFDGVVRHIYILRKMHFIFNKLN